MMDIYRPNHEKKNKKCFWDLHGFNESDRHCKKHDDDESESHCFDHDEKVMTTDIMKVAWVKF